MNESVSLASGARPSSEHEKGEAASTDAPQDADGRPRRVVPSTADLVRVLVGVPALAGVVYVVGGVILAVQAQQVGLPWLFVVSNVDSRTLLASGLRGLTLSALCAFLVIALGLAVDRLASASPAVESSEPALDRIDRLAGRWFTVAGVFVAGIGLTSTVVGWTDLAATSRTATGIVLAVSAVLAAGAGLLLARTRRGRDLTNGTTLLALLVFIVGFFPLALGLGYGTLIAALWWLQSVDPATVRRLSFRLPQLQVATLSIGLTFGLLWATSTDLKLPTRSLPGQNQHVGVLATADGTDLVVQCDASDRSPRPSPPRVLRTPTAAGPTTETIYRVPRRTLSTLWSILTGKRASQAPFQYETHDCGKGERRAQRR